MQYLKLGLVLLCHCIFLVACKSESARTIAVTKQDSVLLAGTTDYVADLPLLSYDRERYYELRGYLSRAVEQLSLCMDNVGFYQDHLYLVIKNLFGQGELMLCLP